MQFQNITATNHSAKDTTRTTPLTSSQASTDCRCNTRGNDLPVWPLHAHKTTLERIESKSFTKTVICCNVSLVIEFITFNSKFSLENSFQIKPLSNSGRLQSSLLLYCSCAGVQTSRTTLKEVTFISQNGFLFPQLSFIRLIETMTCVTITRNKN